MTNSSRIGCFCTIPFSKPIDFIPSFTYLLPMKQMPLIKKDKLAYGGTLLNTRKGRERGRPLDTRNTMHLVLRSSKAKGEFSFKKAHHASAIQKIIAKFSAKFGVTILSLANVGNHLHFHIKLSKRQTYKPFIRAITSAIAMAVSGVSRWSKSKIDGKFWDYRPFTRVVVGLAGFLNLKSYVEVNQFEGLGTDRLTAFYLVRRGKESFHRGRPRLTLYQRS